MAIAISDVKLLKSVVMDDEDNGGGGPTANVIPDGGSNGVFNDISELARANGEVSIRQVFLAVQTDSLDLYQGANIIISRLPADANVAITLAKCNEFHRRTDIANAIESYLIQSSEWQGYLLENHVAGQRAIQIFQRPGLSQPPIGRTLVLIYNEGLSGERTQFIRVTSATTARRTFTYSQNGSPVDYEADVVTCEISDALRYNFPGSVPNRLFVRESLKSVIRDTSVADAATYYGASPLAEAIELGDTKLKAATVYSQLVPSARTETVTLDQRPASQNTLTLATTPRLIQVGTVPHSRRLRVTQETRGFSWVDILSPFPAPGAVTVSYMALGQWYEMKDDGLGAFTGAGVGTVNYTNGSLSLTLPSLPDVGSALIISWGEKTGYDNRSALLTFRLPEYSWELPSKPVKADSVTVKYMSGGVLRTAVDNASGVFSGAGTGQVNYATGKVYFKPSLLLDAGAELVTEYTFTPTITENIAAPSVDSGGFGLITLQESPAPGTLVLKWITTRTVSNSAGSSKVNSKATTGSTKTTTSQIPPNLGGVTTTTQSVAPGGTVSFTYGTLVDGTYHYDIIDDTGSPASPPITGGSDTGTFTVTGGVGSFNVGVDAGIAVKRLFGVRVFNASDVQVAQSFTYVFVLAVNPPASVPATLPQSASQTLAETRPSMFVGGVNGAGVLVYVSVAPIAADPDTPWTGPTYDPPAVASTLWVQADFDARGKTLTSQRGIPTFYSIWGG